MLDYVSTFHPISYARAGTVAPYSFTLPSGMLYTRGGEIPMTEDVPLAHSLEPTLRKLGVPTRLEKGKVMLDEEFQVCKEGEVLGSGQTTLLKMFGVAMAEFGVEVRAWWIKETGAVEVVEGAEQMNQKGNSGERIRDVEMDHEDGDLGVSDEEG